MILPLTDAKYTIAAAVVAYLCLADINNAFWQRRQAASPGATERWRNKHWTCLFQHAPLPIRDPKHVKWGPDTGVVGAAAPEYLWGLPHSFNTNGSKPYVLDPNLSFSLTRFCCRTFLNILVLLSTSNPAGKS